MNVAFHSDWLETKTTGNNSHSNRGGDLPLDQHDFFTILDWVLVRFSRKVRGGFVLIAARITSCLWLMFGRVGDLLGGAIPRLSNCRLRPCCMNANYETHADTRG